VDERKWLTSNNVYALLGYVRFQRRAARTKVGRRRMRLFMAACFRQVWDVLAEPAREIVEATEKAADSPSSDGDRMPLYRQAFEFWSHSCQNQPGFLFHSGRALLEMTGRYGSPAHAALGVSEYLCLAQSSAHPPLSVTHPAYDMTHTVTQQRHAELVREIFGNPFRPPPKRKFPAEVRGLAQACYDDHAHYPVLADALDDLGEEAAAHCRLSGHVRGCHVVDWILGKG
jgi:hypothetical protein